jgi:hypothetical protein
MAALDSQGRIFLGRYLEVFDVTDKATYKTVARAKKHSKKRLLKRKP